MQPHPLVAVAALASMAFAQGGVIAKPATPPEFAPWPADWNVSRFAPQLDAQGQPVPRHVLAGGWVDFDRDGNRDLWFLTAAGPGQTQLHALLANTADLGRFWAWADYAPAAALDAATYHTQVGYDMVVAVDPAVATLDHHFFVPNLSAPDPRLSGFWGHNPGWPVGTGCYEIETANHDGDPHDDLLVLRALTSGASEVRLIVMGAPFGGMPSPQREVVLELPWRCEGLRALDAGGDGVTDAVVHVPGIGVLVLRAGEKVFTLADYLPLPEAVRDLGTGDSDGDGCDEVAVAVDGGVILLGHTPAPLGLPNPTGVGPLTGVRIVDLDRNGSVDVVCTLASGDALLVHQRGAAGFAAPLLHRPDVAPAAGAGARGQAMLAFDADRDGDDDLAVQVRDGSFVTLLSRHRSLAPLVATVVHEGRFSESYIAERIDLTMPPAWRSVAIDSLEVGIYMRHPTLPSRPWVLWAHTVLPMAANQPLTASVRLLYLVDLSKLPLLTSAYLYPQGFAVSGDTLLTVHGKIGQQRRQSMLIYHEGRGDENKSTLGVQWRVIAAPPLPRADAQLLPF